MITLAESDGTPPDRVVELGVFWQGLVVCCFCAYCQPSCECSLSQTLKLALGSLFAPQNVWFWGVAVTVPVPSEGGGEEEEDGEDVKHPVFLTI